jgi:hypothetical protein
MAFPGSTAQSADAIASVYHQSGAMKADLLQFSRRQYAWRMRLTSHEYRSDAISSLIHD